MFEIFKFNYKFNYTSDTVIKSRSVIISIEHGGSVLLWFLFNPRINLSPFTKDFRGEEHYNESIDQFLLALLMRGKI